MGDRKEARGTRDDEFQSFVIGRWPRLMRTAFLLTGEQHAAEDLVQSTLEQVFVAWRKGGSADDPEAYGPRVMINAARGIANLRAIPGLAETVTQGGPKR